jgi:Flp pilus assembly protein CpaB
LVIVAGVTVLAVAGAGIYIASGGVITVPFTNPPRVISLGKQVQETRWTPPAGKVAVPASGRAIPAYTKITRDDIWDVKSNDLSLRFLDPDKVKDGVILTNLQDILGRVLDHDKPAGYVFTKDDFLPAGTRPGLVAGIPAGMRAVRIELSKVRGFYGLNPGDRFDVVSTIADKSDPAKELRGLGGGYGDRLAMEAALAGTGKQATVRVIVQNGIVVSAVQTIEVPMSSASLTKGAKVSAKPVQEVFVAVQPAEVSALTEAMEVGAALTVVPRSGRPDDPKDSVTPDRLPKSPFAASADGEPSSLRFVETIDDKKRELVPVRSTDGAGKAGAPSEK